MTKGKGLPTWMSQSNLTRLNSLADFSMHLMYNSVAKKRITAGESVFLVMPVSLVHHEESACMPGQNFPKTYSGRMCFRKLHRSFELHLLQD